MLDYRLLEALYHVVDSGGFEKAAEKLCITQSAVSQRIKSLEDSQGQILVSRETPPVPTPGGIQLIKHFRQVLALETDLVRGGKSGLLQIGINADSLATWFLPSVENVLRNEGFNIEVKVDDQEETAEMLRTGQVAGCVSSGSRAFQGCRVHFLGTMNYFPMASPEFAARWFPEGFEKGNLKEAPVVIFNRKDRLHDRYLDEILKISPGTYPRSSIPSPEKYAEVILHGLAWGVLPDIQVAGELESGKLILLNGEKLEVPLYWHYWNLDTGQLRLLTGALIEGSGRFFK